ncbi:MAG: c-di-GMP-related signal transduction protein [Paraglaciecola sp.]
MSFYAARQPILNVDKSLFAYELLFRNSLENVFPKIDDNEATSKMIEGLHLNLGLENLTQGKLAFINFTYESLINGFALMLPKEQIVVEILETVTPDKKLLEVCRELKDKGYILALDDYEHASVWLNFFPYIDIIKIDYQLSTVKQLQQITQAIKPYKHIKLLAEKIETHEEYQHAIEIGCVYFQGYFFSKPEVIKSVTFSPTQYSLMNLIAEMNMPDPDLGIITRAFESDVNLSFKLLRYAQSPLFKKNNKIESIKQALVVLGQEEIEKFVSLLFTAQFSVNKPQELIKMSLVRARFCELIVSLPNQPTLQSSGFLVGLFSLLDAMVDTEMPELMDKLPISQQIKDVILLRKGQQAKYLTLCGSFEQAQWQEANDLCVSMGIDGEQTVDIFQQAQIWAIEQTQLLS